MTIRSTRPLKGLALVAALAGLVPAFASAQGGPEKVRGTLTAIEGDRLVVETRDGSTLDLPLKHDAGIYTASPASLDDIKAGDFVGVTSIEQGGQRIALETHLFSEELRGTGEGHYAWDLVKEPNTMTNATIAEVKEADGGRTLEVDYRANEETGSEAGSQTLRVPDGSPVVRLEKAPDRQPLAGGRDVFVMVEPAGGDGPPEAVAVVVGIRGASPPM